MKIKKILKFIIPLSLIISATNVFANSNEITRDNILNAPLCRYNVHEAGPDGYIKFKEKIEKPLSFEVVGSIPVTQLEYTKASNGEIITKDPNVFSILDTACQDMAGYNESYVGLYEEICSWISCKPVPITRAKTFEYASDPYLSETILVLNDSHFKNLSDRVFTAYFSGTAASSLDANNIEEYAYGETISTLAQSTLGEKEIDYLQLDGPGSGELRNHERRTRNYDSVVDDTLGNALGTGTDEIVDEMMAVIKNKNYNPRTQDKYEEIKRKMVNGELNRITHVNCLGFSRGGVECLELAARLYKDEDTKHIKVNMFLLDPVPGFGNYTSFWKNIDTVYENVENIHIVFARDERSFGFTPILPKIANTNKTKLNIDILPGFHGTVAGNHNLSRFAGKEREKLQKKYPGVSIYESGLVARDLAEQFLLRHGTKFDYVLDLGDEGRTQLYNDMVLKNHLYKLHRKESYLPINQLFGKDRKVSAADYRFRKKSLHGLLEKFHQEGLQGSCINYEHMQLDPSCKTLEQATKDGFFGNVKKKISSLFGW